MMAPRPSEAAERPLKDLFSELSGELSFIVSREVELAKTEMSQKASLAAKGGGALAVGGVAALVAVVMLSLAAAWGLAEVLPTGFAFLIVAVVWVVVAAVMLLAGKEPVPDEAGGAAAGAVQCEAGHPGGQDITVEGRERFPVSPPGASETDEEMT